MAQSIDRNEIYDNLADVIAPLVLLVDMSVAYPAKAELSLHADEFAQVINGIVRKLQATQARLYQD